MALATITVAVFAPVRHYDFVRWDDNWYVTENPHVLGGLSWQAGWWALTTGYEFYWQPLTWFSHLLDVQVYGLNAGGHHVTNLVLHVVAVMLLFAAFNAMTRAPWRSAFVAALFAVHPLHVESVAWVAERKDVLSAVCWGLTTYAYVRYTRRPGVGRYLLVVLSLALGLMAKPMLVTLPLALLLLDVWPLGRWRMSADPDAPAPRPAPTKTLPRLFVEKVPLLALAAACSAVTLAVQHRVGAVSGLDVLPLKVRLPHVLVSYVEYLIKTVWPAGLAAYYPHPVTAPAWWRAVLSLLGLTGVSIAAIWQVRWRPYLLVGWLWYLITLVPVIGFVQAGDQLTADRFTYLPLVGLFLIVAWGVPDLLARWPARRIVLPVAAGVLVFACATAARIQLQSWQDSEALWSRALAVTTDNHRAHAGVADALAARGRVDEAIAHYREALRLVPGVAEWHNNLGMLLFRQTRLDEAAAQYMLALRLKPDFMFAHNNLGAVLARQGRVTEAVAEYSRALQMDPDYAQAHHNLALAFAEQRRLDEAIREMSEAVRLEPSDADWHVALAGLFYRAGRPAETLQQLDAALTLNPSHAAARRAHDQLAKQSR